MDLLPISERSGEVAISPENESRGADLRESRGLVELNEIAKGLFFGFGFEDNIVGSV